MCNRTNPHPLGKVVCDKFEEELADQEEELAEH
jgi:hypothetical protein